MSEKKEQEIKGTVEKNPSPTPPINKTKKKKKHTFRELKVENEKITEPLLSNPSFLFFLVEKFLRHMYHS